MDWNKVSERLPEKNMRVIVTVSRATEDSVFRHVWVVDYDEELGFVSWDEDNIFYTVITGVTAWMPMPKAYPG